MMNRIFLISIVMTPFLGSGAAAENRICVNGKCTITNNRHVVIESDGDDVRTIRDDNDDVRPAAPRRVARPSPTEEFVDDPVVPTPRARPSASAEHQSLEADIAAMKRQYPGANVVKQCVNDKCTVTVCNGNLNTVNGKTICIERPRATTAAAAASTARRTPVPEFIDDDDDTPGAAR